MYWAHSAKNTITNSFAYSSQYQCSRKTTTFTPPRRTAVPSSTPSTMPHTSPSTTPNTTQRTERQNSFQTTRDVSHVRDIRLFTVLEKIKQEQTEQREMLTRIYSHLQEMPVASSLFTGETPLPSSINLPLETVEELNEVERELAENSVQASMIHHVSLFGGKNTADTVRRILRRAIRSQLAQKYNWFRKKGKMEFGKLRLASVIYKVIKQTVKNVTEVEVIVREWLRSASDREGGRKRRRESRELSQQNVQEMDESL